MSPFACNSKGLIKHGVYHRKGIIWSKKMVVTISRNRIRVWPMAQLTIHQVRMEFISCVLMCSLWCSPSSQCHLPRVFPITPHFIPYYLHKSFLLHTYIGIKIVILGNSLVSVFFGWWANQIKKIHENLKATYLVN
jgi:hypothetical protein